MSKNISTEIETTKLLSAKRTGIDKLTFKCKYAYMSNMSIPRNVTWYLNNVNVEGYPHFKVTNKYDPMKNILVSKLKVAS